MRNSYVLVFLLFSWANVSWAEQITLKTGKVYEGQIIGRGHDYVRLKTAADVMQIPFSMMDPSSREALSENSGAPAKDVSPNVGAATAGLPLSLAPSQKGTVDSSRPQSSERKPPPPDVSAADVLQKTLANYQSLTSYSCEGSVEDTSVQGETSYQFSNKFTIKLKRPDLYKITWQDARPGSMRSKGVLGNFGEGPFLVIANQTQKFSDHRMAISAAAGVSGGAGYLVPALFLEKEHTPFEQIKNLELIGLENLNGQECYVLQGESNISTDVKFWITKDRYLILKHSYVLDKKPEMPDFTEDQMKESLKEMGMEVNDENKTKLKKMMEMSESFLKTAKITGGTHQELYTKIAVDEEIDAGEFHYDLPPQTQENAMGNVFDHLDAMNYTMMATQGGQLTVKEVAALESNLAEKPDDFDTRVKLVGFYFSKQSAESHARRQKHVLWIIENKPDYPGGEILTSFFMLHPAIDGDAYDQASKLWTAQVEKHPDNAVILKNAAAFFQVYDKPLFRELLLKAQKIDPKINLLGK